MRTLMKETRPDHPETQRAPCRRGRRAWPAQPLLLAAVAAALGAACGSSPAENRAPRDGGNLAAPGDAGSTYGSGSQDARSALDAARACQPVGTATCGPGKICCASGVSGTCTDLGACAKPVQVECWGPGDCGAGQVCCGSFVPAFALASSGGAPDASMSVTVTCQGSCALPSLSLCRTQADCTDGRCTVVPEGGNHGLLAVISEVISVCVRQEAGAP